MPIGDRSHDRIAQLADSGFGGQQSTAAGKTNPPTPVVIHDRDPGVTGEAAAARMTSRTRRARSFPQRSPPLAHIQEARGGAGGSMEGAYSG